MSVVRACFSSWGAASPLCAPEWLLELTGGFYDFIPPTRWGCDDRGHRQIPAASGPQRAGGWLPPSGGIHGFQHWSPLRQVSTCHLYYKKHSCILVQSWQLLSNLSWEYYSYIMFILARFIVAVDVVVVYTHMMPPDVTIVSLTSYNVQLLQHTHTHTYTRHKHTHWHTHTNRIMEIAGESSWKVATQWFNLTKWFSILCGLIQTQAKITTGP